METTLAKAARPGASRRAEEADASTRVLVIHLTCTDPEETHRIAVGNVPLEQRLAVRKATGMPFGQFVGGPDSIDVDSIAVMVWLAKRLNGFPQLAWQSFQRSWPDEIGEGDIEVWAEDTQGRRLDDDGEPEGEPSEVDDPE